MVFSAAAGFGTLAIFGKFATAFGLSTSTLLLFRFIVATVLIWLALTVTGRRWFLSGRQLQIAIAIGLMYAVATWFYFKGLETLTAGVAIIVFYTYPVHVFVISTVFLEERISVTKLLALVLALIGIVLIIGKPSGINLVGVGLVLVAAIGYAAYTTGSRAALATVNSAQLVATVMVVMAMAMVPLGILTGELKIPVGVNEWSVILGIAIVGTALPTGLFIGGLDRIEASDASIIGTSEPLVTIALGVILLGESVTLVTAIGGALVLLGVLLIQRDGRACSRMSQ